ncbi:MAG: ABC transporter ATP-binding protein [Planctomycetaceae bacterium]|nr:ABC transporter ATP-binding protein [Planctomycetaceae bacterium]
MRFIAGMYRIPQHLIQSHIDREISRFELHEFADDLAENYSLGMRQRLIFAAAFLHDPDVLVLDEPMVGLDPRSVRIVKDLLKKKTAEGLTVFMSTHTLAMAEEMADRMGIMIQGKIHFLGTVSELREQVDIETTNLEDLYLKITSIPTTDQINSPDNK